MATPTMYGNTIFGNIGLANSLADGTAFSTNDRGVPVRLRGKNRMYDKGDVWDNPDSVIARKECKSFHSPKVFGGSNV